MVLWWFAFVVPSTCLDIYIYIYNIPTITIEIKIKHKIAAEIFGLKLYKSKTARRV